MKVVDIKNMAGVLHAPYGGRLFDPLGFSLNVPAGRLLFFREAELKHGRIAMLACLGLLFGEDWHPLFGGNIGETLAYKQMFEVPSSNHFGVIALVVMANLEFLYSMG